jgi:hypothetical protein
LKVCGDGNYGARGVLIFGIVSEIFWQANGLAGEWGTAVGVVRRAGILAIIRMVCGEA